MSARPRLEAKARGGYAVSVDGRHIGDVARGDGGWLAVQHGTHGRRSTTPWRVRGDAVAWLVGLDEAARRGEK